MNEKIKFGGIFLYNCKIFLPKLFQHAMWVDYRTPLSLSAYSEFLTLDVFIWRVQVSRSREHRMIPLQT